MQSKKPTLAPLSTAKKMRNIFEAGKDSKGKLSNRSRIKTELSEVSNYLGISTELSFLFSNVYVYSMQNHAPELTNIAEHFGLDIFDFAPFIEQLDLLVRKGYLRRKVSRRRHQDNQLRNKTFLIDEALHNAIIRNLPCPKVQDGSDITSLEVLQQLNDLINDAIEGDVMPVELIDEAVIRMKEFAHLHFMKELIDLEVKMNYKLIYIYVIWRAMNGAIGIDIDTPCDAVSITRAEKVRLIQEFAAGKDPLSKLELIEIKEGVFSNDMEVFLTDKSEKMLEKEALYVPSRKREKRKTITPENIHSKKLFFNEEEEKQLSSIENLLQDENYQEITARMKEKGMQSGFNILFHGYPGTGKTESVYQLAKLTNREIMKVDGSQTKSMWFGESEKMMRRIFRQYNDMKELTPVHPILLFNEADGILTTRKTNLQSGTSNTENAIQNILLECLEQFEGIFIATTNLAQNLDKAFDRRFLYKIEFHPPLNETAAHIWKDQLPWLTTGECKKLASEFPFSGGQIQNVVRKCTVDEILEGSRSSFRMICTHCEQELLDRKGGKNRIGF
jgi:SpoVK/Ycf46/Vps4 family AAA+-type ATPase